MAAKRCLTSAVLFGLISAAPAHARTVSFSAIAGRDSAIQRDNVPPPSGGTRSVKSHPELFEAHAGFAGGLLLEVPLSQNLGIELGGIFGLRGSTVTTTVSGVDVEVTREGNFFETPLLARYHLSSIFSLGLGGYYLRYVGPLAEITKTTSGNTTTTTVGRVAYGTLNAKTYDYGAVAALRAAIPWGIATSLIFEGRYQHGLAEQTRDTSSGYSLRFDDVQLFVGIWFGAR